MDSQESVDDKKASAKKTGVSGDQQLVPSEKNQPVDVHLGIRFIAYLVDWYLGALVTSLPTALFAQKLYGDVTQQNILSFEAPYGLIAGALSLLCAVLYFVGRSDTGKAFISFENRGRRRIASVTWTAVVETGRRNHRR